nr:hypothetical protein [Tanacetum cinerariifolium]
MMLQFTVTARIIGKTWGTILVGNALYILFPTESDLIESLRTHDSSLPISSKIYSLLDEFAGELALLKSIPPRIDETDCDFERDTRLIKKLLYDNSSPRPPEEFVSANSDAEIKSFSPSLILVKDSDSLMEEIGLKYGNNLHWQWELILPVGTLNLEVGMPCAFYSQQNEFAGELALLKLIPPRIDETDCDFERDTRLIEKLLYDNSSPRPSEEFVSANSDAEIKSFSQSLILVKDSDSLMEEIGLK